MDEFRSPAQRDPRATWSEAQQAPSWEGFTTGGGRHGDQPGWGSPSPATGPSGQPQTEGMAIGALVCAIANFFLWFFLPAIVALVLAAQARTRIRHSGGALTGLGMVKAARIVAVVALVLNVVGAGAIAYIVVDAAREAPEGGDLAAAEGETSVVLLEPGDCVRGSTPQELVSSVEVVDCADPHEAEVFANIEVPEGPDGTFPGDQPISDLAETDCIARFQEYVGIPFEESGFDIRLLLPNADSWSKGDRAITCMVAPLPDGPPLEGSVRGARR